CPGCPSHLDRANRVIARKRNHPCNVAKINGAHSSIAQGTHDRPKRGSACELTIRKTMKDGWRGGRSHRENTYGDDQRQHCRGNKLPEAVMLPINRQTDDDDGGQPEEGRKGGAAEQ